MYKSGRQLGIWTGPSHVILSFALSLPQNYHLIFSPVLSYPFLPYLSSPIIHLSFWPLQSQMPSGGWGRTGDSSSTESFDGSLRSQLHHSANSMGWWQLHQYKKGSGVESLYWAQERILETIRPLPGEVRLQDWAFFGDVAMQKKSASMLHSWHRIGLYWSAPVEPPNELPLTLQRRS